MGVLEIVLLIIGAGIFALSFLLPAGAAADGEASKETVREEAKNAVAKEMEGVKERIGDIVDETVTYAVEKTERSLERISNEKIMAVNEYSDTVLEDINKNHKEVMFLYDMLNDKHENLKNTATQVEKTAKEAQQTAKEAELAAKEAEQTVKEAEQTAKEAARETVTGKSGATGKEDGGEGKKSPRKTAKRRKEEPEAEIIPLTAVKEDGFAPLSPKKVSEKEASAKMIRSTPKNMDISFTQEEGKDGNGSNNNEKILRLHNEGRSNVAIARELGLGVGEVKLVIDLFEGV